MLAKLDRDEDGQITWDEFEKTIIEDATTLDRRVYPLAGAMFSAGLSVGTVVPILPVIVHDLGMGPAEFGLAVSAFGLTKLLANAPRSAREPRDAPWRLQLGPSVDCRGADAYFS